MHQKQNNWYGTIYSASLFLPEAVRGLRDICSSKGQPERKQREVRKRKAIEILEGSETTEPRRGTTGRF